MEVSFTDSKLLHPLLKFTKKNFGNDANKHIYSLSVIVLQYDYSESRPVFLNEPTSATSEEFLEDWSSKLSML